MSVVGAFQISRVYRTVSSATLTSVLAFNNAYKMVFPLLLSSIALVLFDFNHDGQ